MSNPASSNPRLRMSCLCKASMQQVTLDVTNPFKKVDLVLCHCDTCRHSSGVLCTSYYPILEPVLQKNLKLAIPNYSELTIAGYSEFRVKDGSYIKRYFCSICGSHVFRSIEGEDGQIQWQVSSGLVIESEGLDAKFSKHINVADTGDGGAYTWTRWLGDPPDLLPNQDSSVQDPSTREKRDFVNEGLNARCACGAVSFHVTQPVPASYEVKSAYPDLMYADKAHPVSLKANPEGEPWWMQGKERKQYMAGTCACKSCRLASGFEIQTWAFIPRINIFFHHKGPHENMSETPFDFAALGEGVVSSYHSSPGVTRDFCSKCGATLFWRGDWRPDLIDVSVGLFWSPDGARAERWLHWWTDRVSFEEETETERSGGAAKAARELITELQKGLKGWKLESDPGQGG